MQTDREGVAGRVEIETWLLERIKTALFCSGGILLAEAGAHRNRGDASLAKCCEGQAELNVEILGHIAKAFPDQEAALTEKVV